MALVDNLVAYYKLDTAALTTDSSGSGFTLTNTNTVGEGTAFIGTACADLGLVNINKRLEIANSLGVTGAITMSFWVKMRTEIAAGTQVFIQQGNATNFVNNLVNYDFNAGTRRIGFNRQKQNVSNNAFYSTQTLGTTNWHHIVYTYDATTMKGYYDGTEVVSQALSGSGVSGATNSFTIGQDIGQWLGTYASAFIDEVGVWSRAVTGAEVTSLYNSGAGFAYPFTATSNKTNFFAMMD